MADTTHGWVVTVTAPASEGEPTVQVFDVAIADARDAMEKVKRHGKADGDTKVIVKSQLTQKQLAALKLGPGEIRERSKPKGNA